MNERMYMVEMKLFVNDRWERAWSWPGDYTMEEAQGLIASEHEGRHKYRISLIPEKLFIRSLSNQMACSPAVIGELKATAAQ